jgi:hypothetical protein
MNRLFEYFAITYYVPPVLLFMCFATTIIGYLNRSKFKSLKLLPVYLIASILQTIITFVCTSYQGFEYAVEVNNYSLFFFVIIEFLVFYNSSIQFLKTTFLKTCLYAVSIFFIIFSIYAWFNIDFSTYIPQFFYITDCICLAIPCLLYFYEVFTIMPLINLSNQPSFWVIIGFSILAICTLPFYLLEHYLYENLKGFYHQICALYYVFYCLLFFLISKAFLCKQEITK